MSIGAHEEALVDHSTSDSDAILPPLAPSPPLFNVSLPDHFSPGYLSGAILPPSAPSDVFSLASLQAGNASKERADSGSGPEREEVYVMTKRTAKVKANTQGIMAVLEKSATFEEGPAENPK